MNCFVCDRELEEALGLPMGGTELATNGHYGSGVFDPMDGSELIIVICDECLRSRILADRVY